MENNDKSAGFVAADPYIGSSYDNFMRHILPVTWRST
jgi:hypothetical protein